MRVDEFESVAIDLKAIADLHGRDLGEGALAIWWTALGKYSAGEVLAALDAHVADPDAGQWMPKPADVVRHIEGATGDLALLAWGCVLGAMQTVGAYRSVQFDDPAIHAAITDMGGWAKLCSADASAQAFDQKRFRDAYRVHRKRSDLDAPQVLGGLSAEQNGLKGHAVEPPVVIASPTAPRRDVLRIGGGA